jgi:hypothetical protein
MQPPSRIYRKIIIRSIHTLSTALRIMQLCHKRKKGFDRLERSLHIRNTVPFVSY